MKFLSIALAALLGMAEGKRSISSSQMKTRIAKGQFNKQTLMAGSKPYSSAARRMEEEEEEWEINGLYSVQFNSCLSLTVQDDDIFEDENLIGYAAEGAVVAQKSYILFSVCYSDDCYYQAEDAKTTFITDIGTFFNAFAEYLPNQVEEYCDACEENADYCSGALQAEYEEQQAEEAEEEAEEDAEEDEDGDEDEDEDSEESEDGDEDGRKLSKTLPLPFARKLADNKIVEYIDCDKCNELECYEEEEENDDDAVVYEFEDALEWLDGLTECQAIEDENDDDGAIELFAGLICNAAGDGVEIGVFFDEECSLYSTKISFSTMMTEADTEYYQLSEDVVEYMFTNDFSCYQPEIEYTNPYAEAEEEEEDDDDDANAEEEVPEAAEWCQELFNGDLEAVNLDDCGVDADAEEEDADDDEVDEYEQMYDWYTYQLTEEQTDDASEVCQVVQSLEGEYSTVFEDATGGSSLYTYEKSAGSGAEESSGSGFFVFLLIALVLGGAGFYVYKSKADGGKREPLISAEGNLA